MRPRKNRIFFLLLAACLVISLCSPAFAEDGITLDPNANSVTFTNKNIPPEGLAVTKQVRSASPDYSAPEDAVFTFVLYVNGKFAPNREYVLYSSSGVSLLQIINPVDSERKEVTETEYREAYPSWMILPRTTDASGRFTLLGGQTAVFRDLRIGDSYEIQEIDLPDGFTQEEPSGNISGMVEENAQSVRFVNLYTQAPPPGDWQSLHITKYLQSTAAGILPMADAQFRFQVTVDGEPWAGQIYVVFDAASGKLVDSSRTTDAEGILWLHGGERALLDGIPKYSEYEVTELQEENSPWWLVNGTDTVSGVIGNADAYVSFTNRNVSFGVRKTMQDNLPAPEPGMSQELLDELEAQRAERDARWAQQDFAFVLSHADGSAWGGVPYYVYLDDGTQLTETARFTDVYGGFTLKPNQTALFLGIQPGEVFHVTEAATAGYVQVTPDQSGYRDQTVTDAMPVVYQFVNTEEIKQQTLSVTKNVVSETGAVDPDVEFVFQLRDRRNAPVARAVYNLGELTLRTGDDGTFTLKSGQTAVFTRLNTDRKYFVEELGVVDPVTGVPTLADYAPKEGTIQSDTLTEDGLQFTFTNNYKSFTDVTLVKTSAVNPDMRLAGAEFKLEKLDAEGNVDATFQVQTGTTGEDGKLTFTGLWSGSYVLTETKAPKDYMMTKEKTYFTVTITPEGSTITGTDLNEDGELVITNLPAKQLPESGSIGTAPFTITGTALIAAAFLLLRRRKEQA